VANGLNKPAGRPQPWVHVVVIFTLASTIETIGFGQVSAFTPLYLAQLHVAPDEIPRWTGILASLAFIVGIPLAPFWGVWADKYSRKLIIARSAYLQALVFLGVALSQNVWHLALVNLGTGFVLGNTGVMFATISVVAPRERVGLALSTVAMGGPLGIALGPLIGGFLVGRIGFRWLFGIDAVLFLVVALMITFGIREDPSRHRSTDRVRVMLRRAFADVAGNPWVLALFGAYFVFIFGNRVLRPFLPIYIGHLYGRGLHLGSPAESIGVVVTLSGLALALFGPIWGRFGDRFGFARAMLAGTVGAALGLFLMSLATDLPQLVLFSVIQGAAAAGFQGLFSAALALRLGEARRSSVLNLTYFPFYFAGVLAPATGTVLYGLGLPNLFRLSALMTLAATVLIWYSARRWPRLGREGAT
jgi:DHA1 family multidrug resistance protein-like MFS transporter